MVTQANPQSMQEMLTSLGNDAGDDVSQSQQAAYQAALAVAQMLLEEESSIQSNVATADQAGTQQQGQSGSTDSTSSVSPTLPQQT